MSWVLAALAGLVAAVVGWGVAAALGVWLAGLAGMSDFEGARGMFAAFVVGPLGGLVAMVLAVWGVLRVGRGRAALGATLARVGAVLLGIVAAVAGAIVLRLQLSDTYTNELPPTLAFEVRAPAAMVPDDRAAVRIEINTDKNAADALLTEVRDDGGERVVVGRVELAMKTRSRLLVVRLPGQPVRLFSLSLGRDPASTPALGDWTHARWIDRREDGGQPEAAPADDPVALRWRVRRAGEP
ncbi:MAG: hypothetical protein KIT14_11645 [bacterium]|nr:hypothetical protein [bacterium]